MRMSNYQPVSGKIINFAFITPEKWHPVVITSSDFPKASVDNFLSAGWTYDQLVVYGHAVWKKPRAVYSESCGNWVVAHGSHFAIGETLNEAINNFTKAYCQ